MKHVRKLVQGGLAHPQSIFEMQLISWRYLEKPEPIKRLSSPLSKLKDRLVAALSVRDARGGLSPVGMGNPTNLFSTLHTMLPAD
jgi:hypothetical protein